MGFLSPLMLAGLLGAALPLAIHLIGRRRATTIDFAALDFLLGSDQKKARRLHLRDRLLLALRVFLCACLALVFAKPYSSCESSRALAWRGPQAAVIVIDNSLAGRYLLGGEPLIARSLRIAGKLLVGLGPEAEVAVLTTAEGTGSLGELSRDHLATRAAIADMEATWQPAATERALRRAAELLESSSHPRKSLYLISSAAASGFSGDGRSGLPKGIAFDLLDPAEGASLDNVAVTGLRMAPDPSAGRRGITVVATIANFSSGEPARRELSLAVGGETVSRGVVEVPAGGEVEKRMTAVLPDGAGAISLRATLEHDALAEDDARVVPAARADAISVLVINGAPRSVRYEDEVFYLESALRPGDRGESGTTFITQTVAELDESSLAGRDVVILANVGDLSPAFAAELESWVRGGGGLLIGLGDQVVPERANERLAALLPQPLASVLDTGAIRGERNAPALKLAQLDTDHPLFSVFSEGAPGLREASFWTALLLRPTTATDSRRVLARYDNGAAAWLESRLGDGRILLFTSSLDRDWNDLAIHPGYLPLVQQAVRYLARRPEKRREPVVQVGHSIELPVERTDVRIEVEGGGTRTVFEGAELAERSRLSFSGTGAPGFYRVWATDTAGERRERPGASFAVVIDPRASDLRRVEDARLKNSAPASPAVSAPRPERRVEWWHGLALALLLSMVLESAIALPGRPRRGAQKREPPSTR